MPHIPWRRAHELGYVVGILELGAVNCNNFVLIAVQYLGQGTADLAFTSPGGPQEEKGPEGTPRVADSKIGNHYSPHYRVYGTVLANDLFSHLFAEFLSLKHGASLRAFWNAIIDTQNNKRFPNLMFGAR
ncbi:MAG: hypothetical protein DMG09_06680 [Acidobacteria bacterium]|nr:MAG: hypothetical protein DMG09_06680 [Acidobacteriota bacterium]